MSPLRGCSIGQFLDVLGKVGSTLLDAFTDLVSDESKAIVMVSLEYRFHGRP